MIQTLIVEDEDNSRNILSALISKYCPQLQVMDFAADAHEAVEKIELLRPDLVFLDIELPYGNAFDILSRVKETDFQLIFTTAYEEYVMKALKAGATDYLLKPIDHQELVEAVQKIEKKINGQRNQADMAQFMDEFSKHFYTGNLALPTMEGYSFIKFDEIIRIAAEGNYCKIYCINSQSFTITRQIHDIEFKLPPSSFCRVHNSHIINMKYIKEYVKGRGGYVTMADGSQVDVSSGRKEQFLKRFS